MPGSERDRASWVLQRRSSISSDFSLSPVDVETLPGTASGDIDIGSQSPPTDPWGDSTQTNFYEYRLWAVDTSGNEDPSGAAIAVVQAPTGGYPNDEHFLEYFHDHYNEGTFLVLRDRPQSDLVCLRHQYQGLRRWRSLHRAGRQERRDTDRHRTGGWRLQHRCDTGRQQGLPHCKFQSSWRCRHGRFDHPPVSKRAHMMTATHRTVEPRRRDLRKEAGVTLVELLIAMMLMLVVMAAVYGVWGRLQSSYTFTEDDMRAQAEAREALGEMIEYIRTARIPPSPASETLNAVIPVAGPFEIWLWTDIDRDPAHDLELVRFWVKRNADGSTELDRQESPNADGDWSGAPIRVVDQNVRNGETESLSTRVRIHSSSTPMSTVIPLPGISTSHSLERLPSTSVWTSMSLGLR